MSFNIGSAGALFRALAAPARALALPSLPAHERPEPTQDAGRRETSLREPSRHEPSHRGVAGRGHAHGHAMRKLDLKAKIINQETSTALTIRTDEGDVVTLSGRTEMETTYASLKMKSRDAEGRQKLDARLDAVSFERDFSLTVEGDLSETELADIKRLLEDLGPALKAVAAGTDGPLALQLEGSRYASLSGFDLSVQRSLDITRLHVRQRSHGESDTLPRLTAEPMEDGGLGFGMHQLQP